ncbi:PTS sugar transporter subunit IIA [Enterococcus cecorum]|uniref:PTS sugar transporter subunit IIA n=1 Tax=Enterococcus cecorum TaxID=44008 RepID=UPI002ACA1330|nr:PTS sugar transporter subunit IIA [Enterococcus cecorum]MDZ5502892.1 PTS sugar transporter subunit IIA [Enterococcus cecorum]MDZ5509912.1 PTS sugar transporter subunit IIA [Enterococcus cecorum]MDZ5556831.1 PTS sugar transporter subunit IIA [Enterococcus cecorum]MDZ5558749.1 PTS sugar transporter subunit IIA [Enterococcus cecorum]MDZ5572084.1 PTS sugar transporter subunit IIA [Enterococcus cecorum]
MKLVVVAHGHFATGAASALELIVGKQEEVAVIDFSEGMSAQTVKEKIAAELVNQSEVLVLSDLLGGTPFKVSTELMAEFNGKMNVLSGLNLAMLIEAAFARNMLSFEELVDKLVTTAKDGVVDARSLFTEDDESEEDFEGGI